MSNDKLGKKSKWRPWGIYFLYLIWTFLVVDLIMKFKLGDLSPFVSELGNLILVSVLFIHYNNEFPELMTMLRPIGNSILLSCFIAFGISFLTEGLIPYMVCGEFYGNSTFSSCTKTFMHWSWLRIAKLAMGVIVAPILEEILFRGVFLKLFLSSYHILSGIILSGLIFGLLHIAPIPGFGKWTMLLSVFWSCCFGVLLSSITYKTRNLSFAFGFHIVNNFLAFLPG